MSPPDTDPPLDLERVDLRLLRSFRAVVECGGFAPAQNVLGVSASTLSTQIAALELRLGLRLCERGRSGFRVTTSGQRVFELSQRLFRELDVFRSELGELRRETVGVLRLGMMDSLVTNTDARLDQTIQRFTARGASVHIKIQILDPASIEKGLVDGTLDVGIAVFPRRPQTLSYTPLFQEEQALYCGTGHPLFARAPDDVDPKEVMAADYVARGYMGERQAPRSLRLNAVTAADNMEAIALLVLSGRFIGYLPVHYAAPWVQRERLRPILPRRFNYRSQFAAAIPKGPPRTTLVEAFLDDLLAGRGGAADPEGVDASRAGAGA